ncbi:MAG: DUF951 domain-containing protein [Clostridia bacterium]|nr:DUF951 domain-containing protein [Clostridia bacterium]
MNIAVGDIAVMKKTHPCGSNEWLIKRTGADVKLKCQGCGRLIMLDRADFEKKVRRVIPQREDGTPDEI